MPIINTVARSANTFDAALNLNAKAHELRRTLAGVWELKPSSAAPPEAAFSLDMKNDSVESVVGGDERVKVEERHFKEGGKYRSIVKLFIHYEFQEPGKFAMGTGWLIAPDMLVTAGHCSYDWSHRLGRATEVKAYIGYRGKERVNDPNVQFRAVSKIVTTEGWLKTRGSKSFDVSFMKLNQAFNGIKPFRFDATPATGNTIIGVVGYPGDLSNPTTGEKGAFMHEMFVSTEWDLTTQIDTMLEYQIDTFGGNSGSPVLRQSDLVSIGAHVYGGSLNSASVIGKYGNPYADYINAFSLPVPKEGLNLIEVTANRSASHTECPNCHVNLAAATAPSSSFLTKAERAPSGFSNSSQVPRRLPASRSGRAPHRRQAEGQLDEEGFLDIFKTAVRVGAPLAGKALSTALPIALGPVGGPIGALAGFALNAAGRLAESAEAEADGLSSDSAIPQGTLERAVLAEAVFQTLQEKELSHESEESIFSDIKDAVVKAAPTVKKVAPKIMGAIMEPALRIALDSLHKYDVKGSGAESFETESEPVKPIRYTEAIDIPADYNTEAFLKFLTSQPGQESIVDEPAWFSDLARAGLRLAGSTGKVVAMPKGLPLLAMALSGGQESFEAEATTTGPTAFSADDLSKRAMLAEASLQAVLKLPPQQLEEEGFFDSIISKVKVIAPPVLKMAPHVISVLNPTVGKIVGGVLGQESAGAEGFLDVHKQTRDTIANSRLRSQLSYGNLRGNQSFLGRLQEQEQQRQVI